MFQFCSCADKTNANTANFLIKYSNEFVTEDGVSMDGYYSDREKFIKPYFSISYRNDTIVATTIHEINACGKTEGQIQISGDTLFLQTIHTSDEVCASVVFHKYTYYIRNTGKKKFIVKG